MNGFYLCPRCGDQGFERLGTYAHCVSCLYAEDYHHDSEKSYFEACRAERDLEDEEEHDNDQTENEPENTQPEAEAS